MKTSLARRLLALALVIGTATDILFQGYAPGINVVLDIGLLLAAGVVAAGPGRLRRVDLADLWLAPTALVLAAGVAVRTDPLLTAADMACSAALAGAALATFGGFRITRATIGGVASALSTVAGAAGLGAVPVLEAARPGPNLLRRLRRNGTRSASVVRGLLLVVPLLVVFAALFAAADAVFADAARRLLTVPFDLPVVDLAARGAAVLVVGWIVAGLLLVAAAARTLPTPGAASSDGSAGHRSLGAAAAKPAHLGFEVGPVEAVVVLVCLDILFLAFVALQLTYLFGGRDTLAASGLTYSEYARRGFFELLAAGGLAALVVAALDASIRRRGALYVVAAVTLLALTGVVLASSFLRLRLYQDAYGWTELRFWVLLAIGWLGAVLVVMAALLLAGRSDRLLHAGGILGLTFVLAANVIGPQGFVTDQNLARALDPSRVPTGGQVGLDEGYLSTLGDDAIPAIVVALPRLPAEDRAAMRVLLDERRAALTLDPSLTGWPAWSLARERAREALATLSAAP